MSGQRRDVHIPSADAIAGFKNDDLYACGLQIPARQLDLINLRR